MGQVSFVVSTVEALAISGAAVGAVDTESGDDRFHELRVESEAAVTFVDGVLRLVDAGNRRTPLREGEPSQ
jgi:hypothetical protein